MCSEAWCQRPKPWPRARRWNPISPSAFSKKLPCRLRLGQCVRIWRAKGDRACLCGRSIPCTSLARSNLALRRSGLLTDSKLCMPLTSVSKFSPRARKKPRSGETGAFWLRRKSEGQQVPLPQPPAVCRTGRAFLAASPATCVVWLPLGICIVVSWRSKGIEYFFSIFSR